MEKFLGTFKLESSEKFDEYLAGKGLNFLLRKLIIGSAVIYKETKKFETTSEEGVYQLTSQNMKSTLVWKFKLNEAFHGLAYSGKQHEYTFNLSDDGEKLHQKEVRPEDNNAVDEYVFERAGDYLLLRMIGNGVEAVWKMKKID